MRACGSWHGDLSTLVLNGPVALIIFSVLRFCHRGGLEPLSSACPEQCLSPSECRLPAESLKI